VDLLQADGHRVHLAHPSGNDWGNRRVKNDERDARDLADLLRLGRLAEAWIAPPATRELRELVRYRAKLVALRSGLKAQVHEGRGGHRGGEPAKVGGLAGVSLLVSAVLTGAFLENLAWVVLPAVPGFRAAGLDVSTCCGAPLRLL
jgi:hypothetical protein